MDYIDKTVTLFALLCIVIGTLALYNLSAINDWERANNYPYGKSCQVFGDCK
jgi:hypothetical protein